MSTSDEIEKIASKEATQIFAARKRAILKVSYDLLTSLLHLPDGVRIDSLSPDFFSDSLDFRLVGDGLPDKYYTEPGETALLASFTVISNADGSLSVVMQ